MMKERRDGRSRRKLRHRSATRSGAGWWLIVRNGADRIEMLTVGGEGDPGSEEEALMVFSFEEEVKMFLRFGKVDGDGWRMRESGAGELVSVLSGPCQDVERVALDPMPEMLAEKVAGTVAGSTLELVSMSRERFVQSILGRARRLASRRIGAPEGTVQDER
jgi:hypothetical protein